MGRTIKFVALSAFWYCVGIFLLAFTSNTLANLGFQGRLIEKNTVWVWALLGAVVSITVGVASWNFSGVGHVRAVRHNVGNGLALGNGWGNAVGGTMQKHGWLIAGLVLAGIAVAFAIEAVSSETSATPFAAASFFFLASLGAFLVYAGKLGDALEGTVKNYKALAWLILSVWTLVLSILLAKEEGYFLRESELFWVALISVILAGLAVMGKLGDAFQGVLTGIGKVYSGAYHPFLGWVAWGGSILLLGIGLFLIGGSDFMQDRGDGGESLQKFSEWVVAVGFFILVFSPLAFKKK